VQEGTASVPALQHYYHYKDRLPINQQKDYENIVKPHHFIVYWLGNMSWIGE
jgi:hypothetical protein